MRVIFLFLAKFFLKQAINKTLKKALPSIFSEIDNQIPLLIANNAPNEVVSFKISQITAKNTNGNYSQAMIDIVTMLYDPATVRKAG